MLISSPSDSGKSCYRSNRRDGRSLAVYLVTVVNFVFVDEQLRRAVYSPISAPHCNCRIVTAGKFIKDWTWQAALIGSSKSFAWLEDLYNFIEIEQIKSVHIARLGYWHSIDLFICMLKTISNSLWWEKNLLMLDLIWVVALYSKTPKIFIFNYAAYIFNKQ